MPERVLVVDDEAGIRDYFCFKLERQGYGVITARDGLEAVEKARNEDISAIIADIKMPGMNGIKMLEEIKRVKPEVTIIMMTGYAAMDSAIEAMELGAGGYVTKPFDSIDEVMSTIKKAVEKTKLMKKLEATRKHLIQAQAERLSALDEMSAGVADKVRNPLSGIRGNAQLFLSKLEGSNKDRECIKNIIAQVDVLDELIEKVCDFTRQAKPDLVSRDINELLGQVLSSLRDDMENDGIRLIENYDKGLSPILVDDKQLCRAFLNIFRNALQAMPEGGRLMVETAGGQNSSGPEEETVKVKITDSGCGIPSESLNKIFIPFFTTKDTERMGLGLSFAQRILKDHGARVKVESEEGKGTTFIIKLPAGGPHGQEHLSS